MSWLLWHIPTYIRMWIYKSSAVVVSSSEYVCSIVSNEHLVSLTPARLPTTICHWIEVTMFTYFGSSAICTSKSFDNTCNATQTTHLYVISVLFLFFFLTRLIHFTTTSILFEFPFKQVLSSYLHETLPSSTVYDYLNGEKKCFFFLSKNTEQYVLREEKKENQFWTNFHMWDEFWMENKQTWHAKNEENATKQKSIKSSLRVIFICGRIKKPNSRRQQW